MVLERGSFEQMTWLGMFGAKTWKPVKMVSSSDRVQGFYRQCRAKGVSGFYGSYFHRIWYIAIAKNPWSGTHVLDTDLVRCLLESYGRKLDKKKFSKSDSTIQYMKDGKKKFQGAKGRLRETQVYPPHFGRKVPQ